MGFTMRCQKCGAKTNLIESCGALFVLHVDSKENENKIMMLTDDSHFHIAGFACGCGNEVFDDE